MRSLERSAAGLEVVGHLSILADGVPLQVEFQGESIDVILPDFRTALHLRRGFSRNERRAWTRKIQAILARANLELRVWVRRQQIGQLTSTSRRGWVAAWLGVDPLELNISAILATLTSLDSRTSNGVSFVDPGSDKNSVRSGNPDDANVGTDKD